MSETLDAIRTRAKAYAEHGTPGLHAPKDRAKLLDALEAVLAHGADRDKYTGTGNPAADRAIRSYVYHVERIIAEALGDAP